MPRARRRQATARASASVAPGKGAPTTSATFATVPRQDDRAAQAGARARASRRTSTLRRGTTQTAPMTLAGGGVPSAPHPLRRRRQRMRRMEVEPGTDAAADARCGAGAGTAADGGNDKRSTVTTIAVFAPEVAHPREAAAAKAAATPTSAASSAAHRKRAAQAAAAAAAEKAVELARGRDGGLAAARPPPCGPRAVRPGSGPEAPARRALHVRGTRRTPSRPTARRPPQPLALAPPPHLLPAAPLMAPATAARPPSPRLWRAAAAAAVIAFVLARRPRLRPLAHDAPPQAHCRVRVRARTRATRTAALR